ncbi:MAG: hypothetical protein EXR21_04410 [Flavobacteriaceae bacterium]|nr:hypothetical protein [Flavobacteriaceae bacterium]
MKASILFLLIELSLCASSQVSNEKKLEYMSDQNLSKAIYFAKENKRPLLIYFNSVDCHSCEMFSSEIMANDSVVSALKSKYLCVNASIQTADGRKYSKQYKAFNLPQLVLVTSDQKVHYIVEMKMDKKHIVRQAKNFLSVGGMRDQVLLLQITKHITWDEACTEMGASYARIDYRKKAEENPDQLVFDRTLNLDMFGKLKEAYLAEWNVQKSRKRK